MARLQAELGGHAWTRFDEDTQVLDTLIPDQLAVPGSSSSAQVADAFAQAFLARHLELLAPGTTPADFILVSDVLAGGVRSVGFVQTHRGLPVIGAQISFRFKHDHLIALRSQVLPGATLQARAKTASSQRMRTQARTWIADAFAAGRSAGSLADAQIEGPMILPLIHSGGTIEYREVFALEVTLDAPIGRWRVYADAETGEAIARESLLHWGQVRFDVYERSPLGPRAEIPAGFLTVDVDGEPGATDVLGNVALSGAVTLSPTGTFLQTADDSAPLQSTTFNLGGDSIFSWATPDPSTADAQLNAYIHAQTVKNRVRSIDPNFEVPLTQTALLVNIDDVCNAFADGDSINFFVSGDGCENTALIADVVYHEYGHVVHTQGQIPGVGLFDGALSEGASDYLAATIVDDASTAPGFFLDSTDPLRELDPEGFEWHWPEDQGEVHDEGRIIGGALWDLRKLMIEKYGFAQGVAKTDEIWLQSLRRSVDIPSMYLEALITNDDDGSLQNGTPDVCEINTAFASHGLYDPPTGQLALETEVLANGDIEVVLHYGQSFAECAQTEPSATLEWRPRPSETDPDPASVIVDMSTVEEGLLLATIPAPAQLEVLNYRAALDWGNGAQAIFPDNAADPWYEHFAGEVTQIWCSDFSDDWDFSFGWDFGLPQGVGGDPEAAFEGSTVAGNQLTSPGTYLPFVTSTLTSPVIDASGFEHVRLQYRRWLNVEDGFFDQATISANGTPVWENFVSATDWDASTHHRDAEWRFHDVPLTSVLNEDGGLQLSFKLDSDGGLEFGGWTVDALCVVGHSEIVNGGELCGDGIVGEFEQCDDGNLQNGDGCSSGCLFEEEPGDTGDTGDTGGAAEKWIPEGRGCGCSTGDSAPVRGRGALGGLMLLALAGLRRRRRVD